MRKLIFAKYYREAANFAIDNGWNPNEYVCVSGPHNLFGFKEFEGYFLDSWRTSAIYPEIKRALDSYISLEMDFEQSDCLRIVYRHVGYQPFKIGDKVKVSFGELSSLGEIVCIFPGKAAGGKNMYGVYYDGHVNSMRGGFFAEWFLTKLSEPTKVGQVNSEGGKASNKNFYNVRDKFGRFAKKGAGHESWHYT